MDFSFFSYIFSLSYSILLNLRHQNHPQFSSWQNHFGKIDSWTYCQREVILSIAWSLFHALEMQKWNRKWTLSSPDPNQYNLSVKQSLVNVDRWVGKQTAFIKVLLVISGQTSFKLGLKPTHVSFFFFFLALYMFDKRSTVMSWERWFLSYFQIGWVESTSRRL